MRREQIRLVAGFLLAAALACGVPPAPPSPRATATPASPTASPIPAPTPTIGIPSDWMIEHVKTAKLTVAHPPRWEIASLDATTFDVRQGDGDGWLQISIIDGMGNNPIGLPYSPGMSGEEVLSAFLPAARQDGAYPDPQPIGTRSGQPAWISEGRDDMHHEQVLIAALGLSDRALLMVGHGGEKPEQWTALDEVYRGIVSSLSEQ